MITTTRSIECTAITATMFLAIELGSTRWKLAFAVTRATRPRLRTLAAGAYGALDQEIAAAKRHVGLADDAPVHSGYEAGRDGFWLHRALVTHGVRNIVVDPSSMAVDRRQRRAKTGRLDVCALVMQLMNAAAGDRRGWREVRVPSLEVEADRQLQREWTTVIEDRKRIRNRIQGVLITQGLRLSLTATFPRQLTTARLWDGRELAAAVRMRLEREWAHLQQVEARLNALRRARRERVQRLGDRVATQTQQLTQLRGVGINGALTLTTELFAWREFTNRRQVGAIVGLTPTPYRSDQTVGEQGISRSGNRRVRALTIELAWAWLRYQPTSALSRWFAARFGQHGRAKRIGIVALARKLLVALWRYVDHGEVPEGAQLKA